MCTASWFFHPNGYELFFNRDELRTRRRALPPSRLGADGEVISPVDADAGGSWIAINRHGLTVALLNRYESGQLPLGSKSARSRGLLVRDLSAEPTAERLFEHVSHLEMTCYAPWTLLVLDPTRAHTLSWDGQRLSRPVAAEGPLASSGRDPLAVPAQRKRLWAQAIGSGAADRAACLAFHRSHQPECGSVSPCMHRSDARTVSLTHVIVDQERVAMAYSDGPPCKAELGAVVSSSRLPAVAAA